MCVCAHTCACRHACILSALQQNKGLCCGEGHFEHVFTPATSAVSSPIHFKVFLCLLYIWIYNISRHSFSDLTSVNTSSSCHLLQESQYCRQDHFVHKDYLQISCLYVWHFVNEGNVFIIFFPDEVDDDLGSF